jgi:hypothetical protein
MCRIILTYIPSWSPILPLEEGGPNNSRTSDIQLELVISKYAGKLKTTMKISNLVVGLAEKKYAISMEGVD